MTHLDSRVVKIKKRRECFGCAKQFGPGNKLERWTTEDGGSVSSVYMCRPCVDYYNALELGGDEIGFNDFGSDPEYHDFLKSVPENEKHFHLTTAEQNKQNDTTN